MTHKIYSTVILSKAVPVSVGLACWCTFSEQEIQTFYWQNTWSWWNAVWIGRCHIHDMPLLHRSQQWEATLTGAEKTFPDSFQSSLSLVEWIGMLRLHRAHAHHAVRPHVLPCTWTSANPEAAITSLGPVCRISIISGREQGAGMITYSSWEGRRTFMLPEMSLQLYLQRHTFEQEQFSVELEFRDTLSEPPALPSIQSWIRDHVAATAQEI